MVFDPYQKSDSRGFTYQAAVGRELQDRLLRSPS